MKRAFVVLVCIMILTALAGCAAGVPEKPETNLEFWIAENVDNFDFSGYRERPGMFGGREYYGSGYAPEKDSDGNLTDPAECVVYTVTAYPDYSSGKDHVTGITVTDPNVNVYGLTVDSSPDEIRAAMERSGFRQIEQEGAAGLLFEKGKLRISFTEGCIRLSTEVTNREGIIF